MSNEQKTLTIEDVVMKLIGPVTPIGEANTDAVRLQNLNVLTTLIDDLNSIVAKVVETPCNKEYSIELAIEHAKGHMKYYNIPDPTE